MCIPAKRSSIVEALSGATAASARTSSRTFGIRSSMFLARQAPTISETSAETFAQTSCNGRGLSEHIAASTPVALSPSKGTRPEMSS